MTAPRFTRIHAVLLITLLLAGLAGYGFWRWYVANTEVVTQSYFRNSSMDPAQGHWRNHGLLRAWLEKLDVELRRPGSIGELLGQLKADDNVLILTRTSGLDPVRAAELLAWVNAGGRLIIEAYALTEVADETDPLLEPLGVRTYLDDDVSTEPPVEFNLPGTDRQYRAGFGWDGYVLARGERIPDWRIDGPRGGQVLGYQQGQGEIVVLADGSLFTNARLTQHDHAALLHDLLQLDDQGEGRAWLLARFERETIWQWLWRQFKVAILLLGGLLALLFWRVSLRVGPRIGEPPPGRRALLEHLQASATLIWRAGDRQALINAARAGLVERINRRHPGWSQLPEDQRLAWLAARAGYSPNQLRDVLYADHPPQARGFTLLLRRMHKIRNRL